jgi:exosortase D (VPLPA-CTERM-specific)
MTTSLNRTEAGGFKQWLPGFLVLGALVFAYWPVIESMVQQWLHNEDYSHGLLVVPVAGYLAWRKREQLKAAPVRSDWRGLIALFAAVAVFIVGELGAELFTTRVSLLVFVIGVVWLLYGLEALKILSFPLGFLFLMLPLPGFIYRNVTFPLQMLASIGSVKVLHSIGISALREGNVIDMGFMKLQVVEACSGLRYILPFLTLGVLFAYLGQKAFWKRAVLVLATVPISVGANVLRISGTGFIGLFWGNQAAEGFFHSFSGWIVFMVCIACLSLLNFLLKYFPGKKGEKKEPAAVPPEQAGAYRLPWATVAVSVAIILATPSVVNSLGQVPPLPLSRALSEFPLDFEGWRGQKTEMDPKLWERVGGQDYFIINYGRDGQRPLNLYVVYYEYQRKGGDFVHSPRLCLPGEGWFIEKNHVRTLEAPSAKQGEVQKLELNELVIQRGNDRNLVYFWYQGRGRNFTNEFAAKFFMVWDGLWRRRTDGAMVRIVKGLDQGKAGEETRAVMDAFALAVSQELQKYLP